jgi:hypothetical protein
LLTKLQLPSSSGYGQVRPPAIDEAGNGDPERTVSGIVWQSWGGSRAIGTGTGWRLGQYQTVADRVVVVAFDLGTYRGQYVYDALKWYFPQIGGTFDPQQFEDVCVGAPYPPSDGGYEDDGPAGTSAYFMNLSGAPAALSGSVGFRSHDGRHTTLFTFSGTAQLDGSLTIKSNAPGHTGGTYTGEWVALNLVIDNCGAFLNLDASGPRVSCRFAHIDGS